MDSEFIKRQQQKIGKICEKHNKPIKMGKWGLWCGSKDEFGTWCSGYITNIQFREPESICQKANYLDLSREKI